jgi:uncharacterized protein YjbJ (UPF0337 family)
MNADVIKGKWKQVNGRIKERWGNLTDDDLDVAEGHSEYLAGKLQERYGWTKEGPSRKYATSAASCKRLR